jgi:hypothetical protein
MPIKKLFLIPIFSIFFFASISTVFASFDYTPMEKIPGFETETTGNFCVYINAVYKFGLWTIGICAMFMIIIGGYMYIVSAGNNASMGKAKGVITDAIIGLLLAFFAWLILNEINPNLVQMKTICKDASTTKTDTPSDPKNPSKTCAFTYSDWQPNPCTDGTDQTRTSTSSPAGCTGGTPEATTRKCNNSSFSCSGNKCTQVDDAAKNNSSGVDPNVIKTVLTAGEGCNKSLSKDGKGSCGYSQALPKIRAWCGITGTAEETCAKIQNDTNLDVNCAAKLIKDNNRRCPTSNIQQVGSCYNSGKANNCSNTTSNYCGRLENYFNNCANK